MERVPGQCPFLKQQCIGERCELWGGINLVQPGKLAGTVQQGQARGCVFNLIVLLLGTSRPTPISSDISRPHN
ncbi:hypothetical protein ES703_93760 [subsurface metagenome]